MKAVGLDNISDDSLRTSLIKYYDFLLPRTENLLRYHRSENSFELEESLEWELFEYGPKLIERTQKKRINKIAFKTDKVNSLEFKRYLNLKQTQAGGGIRRLESILNSALSLLDLVEETLE